MTTNSTVLDYIYTPPTFYSSEPVSNSYSSNARLQVMYLDGGKFILVLDNWTGLGSDDVWTEGLKEETGASAVLIFSTKVDVI